MIETASEAETITLEVRHGNRRFPMLTESKHIPSENQIRELRLQPAEESLPSRLAEAIFRLLPWSKLGTNEKLDRDTVVRAYNDSLKKLDACRQEVETFVAEACRANLEFRQQSGPTHVKARGEVMNRLLSKMIEEGTAPWDPVRSIATAELLSKSPQHFQQQFEKELLREATRFSVQLIELLKHCVDKELFGLAEWFPNQCCRYHFFRRVAIQGKSQKTQSTSFSSEIDGPPSLNPFLVGKLTLTTTESALHEVRYARHEHELINAIRTNIANSTVAMPAAVLRMINYLPPWLVPFVEVIDGNIVRERIIERDVSTEHWTNVTFRDELIYEFAFDPGIVIGPYVLCGWMPTENPDNQGLNDDSRNGAVNDSNGLTLSLMMIVGGLSVHALWLVHQLLTRQTGSLILAIFSSTIATGLVGMVTFQHARRRRYRDPRHYAELMATVFALCLILVGLAIAKTFLPVPLIMPIIAGGMIVMFVSLSRGCR
jgi:hypothetical protein